MKLVEPNQYEKIQHLLGNAEGTSLYCEGILSGKYAGKVLVDNTERPSSAVIIKHIWCHFVGNPNNEPFCMDLKEELATKQFIGEDTRTLFFVDPSPAWLAILEGLVDGRRPIKMPRCLYLATPQTVITEPSLPEGFEVCFIDDAFLTGVEGDLPSDVQKVLDLRHAADKPDEMAFGYVVKNGRSICAWAVIDYIVGERGEIRLVTDSEYRKLGLATAVSAQTIQYGLTHGLTQIEWDVASANIGSIRTAHKLGLTLHHNHTEYILIYPKIGYLINLAWSHLDAKDFEQAKTVANKMIVAEEEILIQYGHFLLGCAWAGGHQMDKAIAHLHKAVDAGFDDVSEMEHASSLKIIRTHPEWSQIMAKTKRC